MTPAPKSPTSAWNVPGWVKLYDTYRATTKDIYPSEWLFLKELLAEGISVLDIGCAVGGLASVLSEHLARFDYTGVDISRDMIVRARQKHPGHRFHVIEEADLSVLTDDRFDLVVCFGVLHLSLRWRKLIGAAWARVDRCLLFDLRETSGLTIEDETVSYLQVGKLLQTDSSARLPYNIINSAEALGTIIDLCAGAVGLQHYGYLASPSSAAVTSTKDVMMNTYRIDKQSLRV